MSVSTIRTSGKFAIESGVLRSGFSAAIQSSPLSNMFSSVSYLLLSFRNFLKVFPLLFYKIFSYIRYWKHLRTKDNVLNFLHNFQEQYPFWTYQFKFVGTQLKDTWLKLIIYCSNVLSISFCQIINLLTFNVTRILITKTYSACPPSCDGLHSMIYNWWRPSVSCGLLVVIEFYYNLSLITY